jgi:hypothetical protein
MGWNYDHAPYEERVHLSALQLDNLSRQVAHVVTSKDWRIVLPLFDQLQHADGPFDITPSEAGPIANVLRLAACSPRMSDGWDTVAHQLADAADTAAKQREPWHWS